MVVPMPFHLGYHESPIPGLLKGFGHIGLGGTLGWADPSTRQRVRFRAQPAADGRWSSTWGRSRARAADAQRHQRRTQQRRHDGAAVRRDLDPMSAATHRKTSRAGGVEQRARHALCRAVSGGYSDLWTVNYFSGRQAVSAPCAEMNCRGFGSLKVQGNSWGWLWRRWHAGCCERLHPRLSRTAVHLGNGARTRPWHDDDWWWDGRRWDPIDACSSARALRLRAGSAASSDGLAARRRRRAPAGSCRSL